MSAVEVRGLWKNYDGRDVLRNIDLSIEPGEIVAIMGSSGGGKTTLLRCISGLIAPSKGDVTVDGVDVNREPEEARRHMGMVFQSAALFDYMNVEDNVLFGLRRMTDIPRREQGAIVKDALAQVGMDDSSLKKMPSELSGGMRKRVGIARAVALRPKVMLYDEPTTGLDPITTYTIDSLIVQLRRELGITSLVVSHDISSVFRTADRIAFLHQGELVFKGSADEFSHSNFPAIRELIEKAETSSFSEAR